MVEEIVPADSVAAVSRANSIRSYHSDSALVGGQSAAHEAHISPTPLVASVAGVTSLSDQADVRVWDVRNFRARVYNQRVWERPLTWPRTDPVWALTRASQSIQKHLAPLVGVTDLRVRAKSESAIADCNFSAVDFLSALATVYNARNAPFNHPFPIGPKPRPVVVKPLVRDVRPRIGVSAHLATIFRTPFFQGATQRVIAAEAVAKFQAASYDEEQAVEVRTGAGLFDKLLSNFGSYGSYHRSSNRWHRRLQQLRELREELMFESSDVRRIRTPVNEQWVGVNARKVVAKQVEAGTIESRHAHWFKSALVEVFFMKDDDDRFLESLRGAYERSP